MKLTLTTLLFLVGIALYAQQRRESDVDLMFATSQTHAHAKQSAFKGLLQVYNRYFSEQIINDCIYEHSCSTFSQGAIIEYGLIKGGLLSADRLMRCNRASALDVAPVRINNEGKIKDHWFQYTFK